MMHNNMIKLSFDRNTNTFKEGNADNKVTCKAKSASAGTRTVLLVICGSSRGENKPRHETRDGKAQRIVSFIFDMEKRSFESEETVSGEKKQKFDVEDICVVCMETGSVDKPLLPNHQCKQCVKNSWRICVCCNESLLSRTCPVCRGNYAPIVLHPMPGVALSQLANSDLDPDVKSLLLYKFGIIRHLIGKSNVAVWSPHVNVMHFSLPQEFAEDTKDFSCLAVSVPMTADRFEKTEFCFDNKVWDEIEAELEGADDEVNSNEIKSSKVAIQWILSKTKEQEAQLYTMMTPAEWDFMLDPSQSADTAGAIQAIKENLVLPTLEKNT